MCHPVTKFSMWQWLENDFIGYLDDWAKAVAERDPGKYTNAERKKMMIPDETLGGLRRTGKVFVEFIVALQTLLNISYIS